MNAYSLTISNLLALILVFFRVSGAFVASPLLSNHAVPTRLKVIFILVFSFLILPIVPHRNLLPLENDLGILIVSVLREVTIGFVLGFASSMVFVAVQCGGEIFGINMGFAMATIFDPANEDSSGVITSLYVIMGSLLFLYFDGHHLILAALAHSFKMLPLGENFNIALQSTATHFVSTVFMIAIQLAAPIMVVCTLLNLIFGILTKLSPQLNIYANTGFIVLPLVGVVVLAASLPLFRFLLTGMTERLEPELVRVLQDLKGVTN